VSDDRTVAQSYRGGQFAGADFTGADLRSADFTNAKIGVVAILVAIACGVTIGWAVSEMRTRLTADEWDQFAEGGSVGITCWLRSM